MAIPKPCPFALRLVAIFSRFPAAMDAAAQRIADSWGPIALRSEAFDHAETDYYRREMGVGLKKQFLIVDGFFDLSQLPAMKLESNAWERAIAEDGGFPAIRPVNIDPGYITLSKLVLASAKDRAHRIYLDKGIYGEECLYYLGGRWHARPWTYPDYRRPDFHAFFLQARKLLKEKLNEEDRMT